MKDVTKLLKKKFFEVKDLNQALYNGQVPAPVQNAFWSESRKTSEKIAGKKLKNAAKRSK